MSDSQVPTHIVDPLVPSEAKISANGGCVETLPGSNQVSEPGQGPGTGLLRIQASSLQVRHSHGEMCLDLVVQLPSPVPGSSGEHAHEPVLHGPVP